MPRTRAHPAMRPQDIVVLVRLLIPSDGRPLNVQIARDLLMSPSEVGQSIERSRLAGMVDPQKRIPLRHAVLEFVLCGLRYAFPAIVGPVSRGLPTAHSAPPLARLISGEQESYVWSWSRGTHRGQTILPLYHTVPEAAASLPPLHEMLALIDALRVGRARERNLAREILEERVLEERPG